MASIGRIDRCQITAWFVCAMDPADDRRSSRIDERGTDSAGGLTTPFRVPERRRPRITRTTAGIGRKPAHPWLEAGTGPARRSSSDRSRDPLPQFTSKSECMPNP